MICLDEPSEFVDFTVKYKDWIAVKKLGVRDYTKPEEVVFHLAGVRNSIEGKMYKLLGINTEILDAAAENITKGARKSYGALTAAIGSLSSADAKKAVQDSCSSNKDLAAIAETYLLAKIIKDLGYDTCLNQVQMSKVFPELKLPKAPGRMGKGKKKE